MQIAIFVQSHRKCYLLCRLTILYKAELALQLSGGDVKHLTGNSPEAEMSYCHDIHLAKDFDRIAFAAATRDVRTLISRSEVKVVGPAGRPMSEQRHL